MKQQQHTGLSLYWKCQLIGWSIASLYWGYQGALTGKFIFPVALVYFLSDVIIYILVTHLYRNFALHNGWHKLDLRQLVIRIIPAIVALGIVYLLVTNGKTYALRSWFYEGEIGSFKEFFSENWSAVLMAGFRLMTIWVLAYHMYHYAQREINIVKENARLALISKEAQLSNLSSQLNPHFFFNSLNTIKCLVIEDPGQARRAIDLLSDLLRNALYVRDDKLVSLKEEINLVKDYLELEKLRLEERLRIQIDTDPKALQYNVPPFSVQALVENAIKHGIDKKKDGGLIALTVKNGGDFIEISIQNPGKLDQQQNGGIGLKNLQERLQLQFEGKATFSIKEYEPGTILATISIPVA
ncbi:MAG TPA: histidine kinase [Chitinophagaceae bacterium]|jgi:signal transduction histidine kinase|nr:histidine kinase [Chitinophagaceae bacterium]